MSVLHAALFVWIAAVGCVANNAYRPSKQKCNIRPAGWFIGWLVGWGLTAFAAQTGYIMQWNDKV